MYAPSLKRENFTALTRLDQNRAAGLLSLKTGVEVDRIKNVIIWGNHSATQFPDVDHGYILDNKDKKSIVSVVNDQNYLRKEFVETVAKRGAAIIQARK